MAKKKSELQFNYFIQPRADGKMITIIRLSYQGKTLDLANTLPLQANKINVITDKWREVHFEITSVSEVIDNIRNVRFIIYNLKSL